VVVAVAVMVLFMEFLTVVAMAVVVVVVVMLMMVAEPVVAAVVVVVVAVVAVVVVMVPGNLRDVNRQFRSVSLHPRYLFECEIRVCCL
jgi:hypothetical protein